MKELADRKPFMVACIPAYNEEENIGGVLIRAMKHVYRVMVCDDGLTASTCEVARCLG